MSQSDDEGDTDYERTKELQRLEQSGQAISDHFPGVWWGLYRNNIREGFTETQAFELVKVYVVGCAGGSLKA